MSSLIYHLVLIGLISVCIGAVAGFGLSHAPLRKAFFATGLAICRLWSKQKQGITRERKRLLSIPPHEIANGRSVGVPPSMQNADADTVEAAQIFYGFLKRACGNDVESLYLFGSRARGDFAETSDVDLAVIFFA